jgi:hypothetical protein
MRSAVFVILWVICMTAAATAQNRMDTAVPRMIGNRANGFSYQPTRNEVRPREVTAGVRPSKARQAETDRALETMDRSLLRAEGMSAQSVPAFTPRQQ